MQTPKKWDLRLGDNGEDLVERSHLRFRHYPEMKLLRLLEPDFFPGQVSQELNALEVYDRFGGSCMEEVLEKGSCIVTA